MLLMEPSTLTSLTSCQYAVDHHGFKVRKEGSTEILVQNLGAGKR